MIRNVIEYLQQSAEAYPNKTAFVDEKSSITYAELNRKAKNLAALINVHCNGKKNCPIAVYMEKSVDCITAFMGVAYSGNFYSPLDVKSPSERVKKIVDTLQPIAVVYDGNLTDAFGPSVVKINFCNAANYEPAGIAADAFSSVLDVDPLYVMFTSGSTGQPKGVVINHRSVIDYTEWLKSKFNFTNETIFGNQAPFYFDNSILDIYSTLKNGAEMVIIPEHMFTFQNSLIEYINQKKIDTLFWVPSALTGLANSGILNKTDMPHLKKVLFCGEVMPNRQLNIWRKRYPHVLYANLYGPTEITDVCSYYIVDREFSDEEPLPIGTACENTEIIILNAQDQLVEGDEIGELCVRGICLSPGYYGDAAKTNASFVQNPLNAKYREFIYRTGDLVKYNDRGEIIYIGRKDFQIKHQGYRIELGEIEAAAYGIPQMQQCCAVYDTEQRKIVLFCVLSSPVSERAIYSFMKAKVPKYMLPGKIQLTDSLPLNANGKIDRAALKQKWEDQICS